MFRPLLALALFFFLFACEDDDARSGLCRSPDQLNNCTDLRQLSVVDHFQAIVGQWTMVFYISSPESISPFQSCGSEEIQDANEITFNADSTYRLIDGDLSSTGRWQVIPDTSRLGSVTSRVVMDSGLSLRSFGFLCNDDLAYTDQRPLDGDYRLFIRN